MPVAQAAEVERKVETKLRSMLEQYDSGPVEDPLQALLDLAGEAVAWKDLLGDKVAALRADDWRWEGRTGEQTRAELALYERGIDRAGKILADIARLNIDERLAVYNQRIESWQAEQTVKALEYAFSALPSELGSLAQAWFAAAFRAVANGEPLPPPPTDVPDYVRADQMLAQLPAAASSEAAVVVQEPLPAVPEVRNSPEAENAPEGPVAEVVADPEIQARRCMERDEEVAPEFVGFATFRTADPNWHPPSEPAWKPS